MTAADLQVIEPLDQMRDHIRLAFLEERWRDVIEIADSTLIHHRANLKQLDVDRIVWSRNKAKDHLAAEGMV